MWYMNSHRLHDIYSDNLLLHMYIEMDITPWIVYGNGHDLISKGF